MHELWDCTVAINSKGARWIGKTERMCRHTERTKKKLKRQMKEKRNGKEIRQRHNGQVMLTESERLADDKTETELLKDRKRQKEKNSKRTVEEK